MDHSNKAAFTFQGFDRNAVVGMYKEIRCNKFKEECFDQNNFRLDNETVEKNRCCYENNICDKSNTCGYHKGVYTQMYDDKLVYIKIEYTHNGHAGVYRSWYPYLNEQNEQILKQEFTYFNKNIHGEYSQWYKSGNPSIKSNYKDGSLCGSYKAYLDIPNTLYIKTNFINGLCDGIVQRYSADGLMVIQCFFERGYFAKDELQYFHDDIKYLKDLWANTRNPFKGL